MGGCVIGKGSNQQLLSNSGVGQSRSNQTFSAAGNIGGPLTAQLQQEATNPQGYTPQQLAYQNTASQQSLGGGEAATTGQANLTAARTNNKGAFQGAVGDANRSTQQQASENAVQIQANQANLQQQQKQQALSALQSLYGVDEQTALGYMNSSNSALGAEDSNTGANSLFGKLAQASIQAAGQAASASHGGQS